MLLYVDNILLTENMEKIVENLQAKYNAKLIGEFSMFLGFDIKKN